MKVVEVRRHSIRKKGRGLSRKGIKLAREIAKTLDSPYDLYISSPKRRCRKTMEAFGFNAYVTDNNFSAFTYKKLKPFLSEIKETAKTLGCSSLEACFKLSATAKIMKSAGRAYLRALREVATKLPDGGKALIVSHSWAIEPAAIVAMKKTDLSDIGGKLKFCEGVLFYFNGNRLVNVEMKRIKASTDEVNNRQ